MENFVDLFLLQHRFISCILLQSADDKNIPWIKQMAAVIDVPMHNAYRNYICVSIVISCDFEWPWVVTRQNRIIGKKPFFGSGKKAIANKIKKRKYIHLIYVEYVDCWLMICRLRRLKKVSKASFRFCHSFFQLMLACLLVLWFKVYFWMICKIQQHQAPRTEWAAQMGPVSVN